jgi:hypothetical protein
VSDGACECPDPPIRRTVAHPLPLGVVPQDDPRGRDVIDLRRSSGTRVHGEGVENGP